LGQARGEFLAPDSPLGLPAVLPALHLKSQIESAELLDALPVRECGASGLSPYPSKSCLLLLLKGDTRRDGKGENV
jgi:hypothetical protein